MAEVIAEVDEPVAAIEAFADQIMDAREAPRLPVDGADRPNPAGITQLRKSVARNDCSQLPLPRSRDRATPPPELGRQDLLDALRRGRFVDPLNRREFAHEPI